MKKNNIDLKKYFFKYISMTCLNNNQSSKWGSFQFINYLKADQKEVSGLPDGISVSTIGASCKLNTRLNIPNIEKYLQLNSDDIVTVKQNDGLIRTLVSPQSKVKRNILKSNKSLSDSEIIVPNTKSFYNQITVVIRVNHGLYKDLNNEPKINVKLFRNGSVQMSGSKSLKSINIVLNKLIVRLNEVKAKFENNIIVEKNFIENRVDNLIQIDNFKINLINSNYKVNMQIDREKLYNLLVKKKVKSSYEPCIRACVIIKFIPKSDNEEQKEVSVFVFQAGNIIITGARSRDQVIDAYNYINNILLTHSNDISKKDEKEEEDAILSVYKNILKDINIGLIKV